MGSGSFLMVSDVANSSGGLVRKRNNNDQQPRIGTTFGANQFTVGRHQPHSPIPLVPTPPSMRSALAHREVMDPHELWYQ